ncbi:MAG: DNA methylase [Clostridia bacterium]|nr:DNA methylase [Clostridia bacterium]
MQERIYAAIDLKSFYASVECVERGLDPLRANLVVADASRTEKTICLAVSPPLKSFGIPGRARLFEVIEKVNEVNSLRRSLAPGRRFSGKSYDIKELENDPSLELDYIVAPPQMAKYMEISAYIFSVYMRYISPDDIHVYSVDEVFMDITSYLKTYRMTAHELVMKMIKEVLSETGITATAGIGTNLYLCKIAMDIVAKHIEPDSDGVRIAELDEMSYRRLLWDHTPITDFWRVGKGTARRLEKYGMFTMGDIARCSVGNRNSRYNEDLLYKLFGINAELLIDHAWGREPCTIADIKAYRPENNSLSSGQVLKCGYSNEAAGIVIREMADALALELFEKGLCTDQIVLNINYDAENLTDPERRREYKGEIERNYYGKLVPKSVHASVNLGKSTSSGKIIGDATFSLFRKITDESLLIRRMNIAANHVVPKNKTQNEEEYEQLDLFTDYEAEEEKKAAEKISDEREENRQRAVLEIKKKFGKNAILKGLSYKDGATAKERNSQIGGHKK